MYLGFCIFFFFCFFYLGLALSWVRFEVLLEFLDDVLAIFGWFVGLTW